VRYDASPMPIWFNEHGQRIQRARAISRTATATGPCAATAFGT